jgi:GNAT superfamily N-acetyltransferase
MIITYQPISGVSATSTRHYQIDELTLTGMVFTALHLIGPERIVFQRDNKEIIDLYQVSHMDFSDLYQTNEFLKGIREMCFLLGVDPAILVEGIDFDYKLQKLILPNNTMYPNGTTVDINELYFERKSDMIPLLNNCFPEASAIGITVPCTMYLYLQNNNLIAVTMAMDMMPYYLSYLDGWYLFNVCTYPHYQGQGIGKSLLICTINDLILKGSHSFILEVDVTNTKAYKLYTGLGFVKINTAHSVNHNNKPHDVLQLSIGI